MARVKLWRLAALGAVPLVLVALDRAFVFPVWHESPRGLRSSAERAVNNLRAADRLQHHLDSLASIRQRREQIGGVTLVVVGDTTPLLGAVRREISREIARLPQRAGSWANVVVTRRGRGFPGLYDAAIAPGQWNPCIMVPRDAGSSGDTATTWPHLLGQCAFASYGPPGSAVRDWIAATTRRSGEPAFGDSRADQPRDAHGVMIVDAGFLSRQWYEGWSDPGLQLLACRGGDIASCRTTLFNRWNRYLRGNLLWWLKERRGDEAFGRFWRFDGSLDGAARAAFGRPLGELESRYLAENYRIVNNGPALPSNAPLAAGSVLVAALGVSLLLARRRASADA